MVRDHQHRKNSTSETALRKKSQHAPREQASIGYRSECTGPGSHLPGMEHPCGSHLVLWGTEYIRTRLGRKGRTSSAEEITSAVPYHSVSAQYSQQRHGKKPWAAVT